MLYICIIFGISFAYISGMHDGGTIIATTVSSGLVSPEKAGIVAGASNFVGGIFLGTVVAYTISDSIVNTGAILAGSENKAYAFVLASFCGCIFWDLFTWKIKLPSSSSHALIGAMIGAAVMGFGPEDVYWSNVLTKVILAMLISPVIGFCCGFIFLRLEHLILKNATMKVKPFVRILHKVSTVVLALSYGSNDAQKAMGLSAIALAAYGETDITIPLWLIIAASAGLALGTVTGGNNMITTVGKEITKINVDNSFSSQLSSIFVLLFANLTGLPISTTQVVTASVMGVGTEQTPRSVNWAISKGILIAWISTIPLSAFCGCVFYKIFSLLL